MVLVSKDAPHSVGMPQHSSAALSQLFSLLFFSFLFFFGGERASRLLEVHHCPVPFAWM